METTPDRPTVTADPRPEEQDCLFCRIVAGEVAAEEAYSTERTYAFHDISPAAPAHVLVVPREHISDAAAIEARHGDLLAEMLLAARQVAADEGLEGGYRLVFNVGEDAGNTVPHLHLHVLGGRQMSWPPG